MLKQIRKVLKMCKCEKNKLEIIGFTAMVVMALFVIGAVGNSYLNSPKCKIDYNIETSPELMLKGQIDFPETHRAFYQDGLIASGHVDEVKASAGRTTVSGSAEVYCRDISLFGQILAENEG